MLVSASTVEGCSKHPDALRVVLCLSYVTNTNVIKLVVKDKLSHRTTLVGGRVQQVIVIGDSNRSTMATGRALTTETEREYLRGEQDDQRMYEARSRVKRRIREELASDIQLFEGKHPELLEELREVVCENE